jgi:hypothetical protein
MIVAGICLISLKPNHSYKNDGIIKENKKRNPLIMILISVFGFFLYFFIPELINNMSNNNS